MADKKKSFNYFTFLLYPDEFPSSLIKDLCSLGVMMISPLHQPSKEHFVGRSSSSDLKVIGNMLSTITLPWDDDLKDHFHVICKSGSKITENSFVQKLCMVLNNDLRGLSINPNDCGVAKPELLIRYFYHLDHPHKQQFDFDLMTLDVPLAFFTECKLAFNVELSLLTMALFDESNSLNGLQNLTRASPFVSWYFWNCKNIYLISQLYKERRELEKEISHG